MGAQCCSFMDVTNLDFGEEEEYVLSESESISSGTYDDEGDIDESEESEYSDSDEEGYSNDEAPSPSIVSLRDLSMDHYQQKNINQIKLEMDKNISIHSMMASSSFSMSEPIPS
eukprot:312775_1